MSKKDTKALRESTNAEQARTTAQQNLWESQAAPEREAAKAKVGSIYSSIMPRLEKFADTGGVDLTNAQSTIDPRIRQSLTGFYGNQMATGGYTPQDLSNIRGRSSSAITSIFGGLKDRLNRAGRAGYGYTPGMGAVSAKLSRQAAQEGAQASRETEAQIAEGIRSGKLSGAGGLQSLGQFEAQNKLQGAELGQRGRLAGMGGLESMYKLALDEQGNIDVNRLRMMGMTGDQIATVLANRRYLSSTPGTFDNIMKGINTAVGVAGAFTGMPSFGKGPGSGTAGPAGPAPEGTGGQYG